MYIEKKELINWLEKELGAKQFSNSDEYILMCPFCESKTDPKKGIHWDYRFNIKKGVGNCWRGFDPRCESGHSILTLVSLYYDISISQAAVFIRKNFQGENSIQRIKKRLKNLDEHRILDIAKEKIVWSMPYESESILEPQTQGAEKALNWLLYKRKIPLEIIDILKPQYLGKKTHKRWKKYRDRVFFPVETDGNQAWLAYSTRSKSTKKHPKTMNPPGHILACMFYFYDWYIEETKPILLHEGLFDGVRFFMYGFNSLVGFGTTVSSEQIELLNKLPSNEVVVCYDPDATIPKKNKKGKWTSRAYKIAKLLRDHYFGDVSIMKLKKEDPDKTSYKEAKLAFKNRMKFSNLLWRIRKLKEKNI